MSVSYTHLDVYKRQAHGYATLKTSDGIEAIELARTHHPALILMDIQLPEVSGLEVTKWIKEDDDLKAVSYTHLDVYKRQA